MKLSRNMFRLSEEDLTMLGRVTGGFIRLVLVMVMVSLPSMLLESTAEQRQMVALAALLSGVLTMCEYSAKYPGLVEFRDAPPFNRLRYLALFMTLLILSVIGRGGAQPTLLAALLHEIGTLAGAALDFPYSPVRLLTDAVPAWLPPETGEALQMQAGMAWLIVLLMLAVFAIFLRAGHWPGRGTNFNVWVNLPTFDPTAGRDVVYRLERDARINLLLGFVLPFLLPVLIGFAAAEMTQLALDDPQVQIWVVALWSFLPASLIMRGIAMSRIATMIRAQRRAQAAVTGPAARYATV